MLCQIINHFNGIFYTGVNKLANSFSNKMRFTSNSYVAYIVCFQIIRCIDAVHNER